MPTAIQGRVDGMGMAKGSCKMGGRMECRDARRGMGHQGPACKEAITWLWNAPRWQIGDVSENLARAARDAR